eukprot:g29538.t1
MQQESCVLGEGGLSSAQAQWASAKGKLMVTVYLPGDQYLTMQVQAGETTHGFTDRLCQKVSPPLATFLFLLLPLLPFLTFCLLYFYPRQSNMMRDMVKSENKSDEAKVAQRLRAAAPLICCSHRACLTSASAA